MSGRGRRFLSLLLGDGSSGDVFGDEEFLGGSCSFPLGDGEDVADDSAGELSGVGEIMAGLGEEVLEPRFGSDGDEREVPWDGELLLGHPGNDGEGVPGPGGDDGGGRIFKTKDTGEGERDIFSTPFLDDGDDGVGIRRGLAEASFGGDQSRQF